MTLKVVQDTSTNWTAQEWREIEALKKILSDSDHRSGRPWVVGAKVNKLAPVYDSNRTPGRGSNQSPGLQGFQPTRDGDRLRDLGLEVGESPNYLRIRGDVAAAWPEEDRVANVSWAAFRALYAQIDRKRILAKLLKEYDPFDITQDVARRAIEHTPSQPIGLVERVTAYRSYLSKFRGQRLTVKGRSALELLRFEIDVLLDEAEEEAV